MPREPAVRGRRPRPSRLGQPADRPDPGRSRPRRPGLLRTGAQRPGRDDRARPCRALVGRRDGQDLDLPAPRRRDVARRPAGHRGRRRLHDPRPAGPEVQRAGRRLLERGRRHSRSGCGRSSSRWRHRSAGSSRPRPSRSRRRTCWPTSRWTSWATMSSGRAAGRLGTVRGGRPDNDTAELVPAGHGPPDREPHRRCVARRAQFIGHARQPTARPGPCRTWPASSSASSAIRKCWPLPIVRATLDGASGLTPAETRDLATLDGSRALATRARP